MRRTAAITQSILALKDYQNQGRLCFLKMLRLVRQLQHIANQPTLSESWLYTSKASDYKNVMLPAKLYFGQTGDIYFVYRIYCRQ
ncbi:hypothetical protein IPL68_01600 [Candidatus Saccharibacteria bacterium]|nr:MAG: hypothetical protein IPL68_01600 [Candidatus Saccharibacteria bacterium]